MSLGQGAKSIDLSKPQPGSGNSFMQLLWKRMSSREFSPDPLPVVVLSNLLWACFGINRTDGKRTAPIIQRAVMKKFTGINRTSISTSFFLTAFTCTTRRRTN